MIPFCDAALMRNQNRQKHKRDAHLETGDETDGGSLFGPLSERAAKMHRRDSTSASISAALPDDSPLKSCQEWRDSSLAARTARSRRARLLIG
ncbi:uncharacterized [Tachysurus ichikawai]